MYNLLRNNHFVKIGKHINNYLNKNCSKICSINSRSVQIASSDENRPENSLIAFHGNWPDNEKKTFLKDMQILQNFLTSDEENKILEEVEPYLKRLRYEYDHWDDAIHGFRETERKNWYPHNREVINRISNIAFNGEIMPYIHILDLDEKGVIKPHVDSTRYCGNTIAGVSLLSNSVMRLIRIDEKMYQQNVDLKDENDSNYRFNPTSLSENEKYSADILLPRFSLYIMSHTARYNFTHEILANQDSKFMDKPIYKTRRISIICRNEPIRA